MLRSRLRNKYYKDKTDASALAYKKQRNKCVSLLRKAKKTYFGNLNPSVICDNKMFWKIVKPLFSEQAVSTNSITLIENNIIIYDDTTITEIFNEFFRNAVKNLKIEPYELFSVDEYFLNGVDDPIFRAIRKYENHPSILKINEIASFEKEHIPFEPTKFELVVQEIFALNTSKAFPMGSIPTKILKENYDIFRFKIFVDFNFSVKSGTFPNNQKYADVSPFFKALDRHMKTNFHPFSILPAISKITERLMFYQIGKYIDGKLSMYQCRFRKGMNAQNCLLYDRKVESALIKKVKVVYF